MKPRLTRREYRKRVIDQQVAEFEAAGRPMPEFVIVEYAPQIRIILKAEVSE